MPERFFKSLAASHSAFISRQARCGSSVARLCSSTKPTRSDVWASLSCRTYTSAPLKDVPRPLVALPFAQFIGGLPWRVHTPEQAAQLVQSRLDVARPECVAGRVAGPGDLVEVRTDPGEVVSIDRA